MTRCESLSRQQARPRGRRRIMAASEIPVQYTHSVKIEDTAKGIRISIHIFTNNSETAVNESIKLYQATKQKAEQLTLLNYYEFF